MAASSAQAVQPPQPARRRGQP